jgi:uncharacterized surface protein with fasciclin (FAS1) repeats
MKKLALVIALAVTSVTSTFTMMAGPSPDHHNEKNIVQIAAGLEDFSTLVAAVKAAGLAETLSGKGPFTVFAPTNKAFAALPEGTVATLLKPENKKKLVNILTYHVIPAKIPASAVKTMKAKTVNGKMVDIKVSDKGVTVDNAKVIKTDVFGSNGVIHVIDKVILPKS